MNRQILELIIGNNITAGEVAAWNTANSQDVTRQQVIELGAEVFIQSIADVLARDNIEKEARRVLSELQRFVDTADPTYLGAAEQAALQDALTTLNIFA